MGFEINESVFHLREGVSKVITTTIINENEYFIVRADRGDGNNIYVPIKNANSIIRHLLTREEAERLFKILKNIHKDFNTNTKQRRDAFRRRLGSGLVEDIGYLFKQSVLYKLNPEGVKLGPVDNEMLDYASMMFLDEMSLIFNLDRDKSEKIIFEKIA